MNFENDIPVSVAQAAHYGTSFVPERRAVQERDGYASDLQADYAHFQEVGVRNGTLDLVDAEFDRYRAGYRKRTLAYLHSRSRLVSTMIAGPSNFPAARMNKRGEISHKRLTELLEYRERAKKAILRVLCPGARPIMAGDGDAVERLEKKIREAERLQDAMKKANVIIRQKPKNEITPEKMADLMTLGLSHTRASELFTPDFCNRIGFASYELTNNGANIRRMKERLEQISKAKTQEASEVKGTHATIEDDPAENRVRLFFPGKPNSSVRDELKANGFRWTPSLECWQAYRNYRSIATAKKVAGFERAIPDHFADEFKDAMKRIGEANRKTPEQIYALWHKYSTDCQNGDQSAIMAEFLNWYREKLPNVPEGMERLGGN